MVESVPTPAWIPESTSGGTAAAAVAEVRPCSLAPQPSCWSALSLGSSMLCMNDRPPEPVDRMLARDRSKRVEMEVVLLGCDRVLLQQPAVPGNHPAVGSNSVTSDRCRRCARRTGRAEQVVADGLAHLAEVVEDPRLDLLRRVGGEHGPHPHRQLSLRRQQREFLIGEIAGVDDAGQSQAAGMGVQIGRTTQPVCRRLDGLERGGQVADATTAPVSSTITLSRRRTRPTLLVIAPVPPPVPEM